MNWKCSKSAVGYAYLQNEDDDDRTTKKYGREKSTMVADEEEEPEDRKTRFKLLYLQTYICGK